MNNNFLHVENLIFSLSVAYLKRHEPSNNLSTNELRITCQCVALSSKTTAVAYNLKSVVTTVKNIVLALKSKPRA